MPTVIGKRFVLGLVSVEEWEQMVLIDRPDPTGTDSEAHRSPGAPPPTSLTLNTS